MHRLVRWRPDVVKLECRWPREHAASVHRPDDGGIRMRIGVPAVADAIERARSEQASNLRMVETSSSQLPRTDDAEVIEQEVIDDIYAADWTTAGYPLGAEDCAAVDMRLSTALATAKWSTNSLFGGNISLQRGYSCRKSRHDSGTGVQRRAYCCTAAWRVPRPRTAAADTPTRLGRGPHPCARSHSEE